MIQKTYKIDKEDLPELVKVLDIFLVEQQEVTNEKEFYRGMSRGGNLIIVFKTGTSLFHDDKLEVTQLIHAFLQRNSIARIFERRDIFERSVLYGFRYTIDFLDPNGQCQVIGAELKKYQVGTGIQWHDEVEGQKKYSLFELLTQDVWGEELEKDFDNIKQFADEFQLSPKDLKEGDVFLMLDKIYKVTPIIRELSRMVYACLVYRENAGEIH